MKYTTDGHWLRPAGEFIQVGLTRQLVQKFGKIIFVELANPQVVLQRGEEVGVVESDKAVSDILMPLTGAITAVNEVVHKHPEFVGNDPSGQGWLFEMVPQQRDELQYLISEDEYLALVATA